MTLRSLQHLLAIVESGSIRNAARQLYTAQSTLSGSVRSLEEEFGIQIFHRSARGISLTEEGLEFLGYARAVVEQADLLHRHYGGEMPACLRCCISTQHYSFSVSAFVQLLRRFNPAQYDITLRETKTHEILEDVRDMRSEIGILYLSRTNRRVLTALIQEYRLCYSPLFTASVHVFLSNTHPLSGKPGLSLEELAPYPFLCFEQGVYNSDYFSEEMFAACPRSKRICVSDRATLFNLLRGVNGYTICSGCLNADLNGNDICSIALDTEEKMEIGYLTRDAMPLSEIARCYLEELKKCIDQEEQGSDPSLLR